MRQLDERAVHVLAAALKDIPLLENVDRRVDLVHSIRQAPGVLEFEVASDNGTHTHLTRITRACIEHRNAPAARRALYEEARRLAGGQRAVSWLRFFNAVLDSRHPDSFKMWLLERGGLLLAQGWGSATAPGVPDPLSEFTWLVVGGSRTQIQAYCAEIDGLPDNTVADPVVPPPDGESPAPEKEEPPSRRRKRWLLAGAGAVVVLAVVIWAFVSAGGDLPTVSRQVEWPTTTLSLDPHDGQQSVTGSVADVPAGRTRVTLPLNLSDLNPSGGACPGTTVDVSIEGQEFPGTPLDGVVHASVPKGRTSLSLKLTLHTTNNCKFLINSSTVDFEG
ncbi:hypothetical protein ACFXDE_03120 [Kitasatospora sp. NPDC059408]|uniref:hypothetical protein n=1 Tax=Kitasatospora sp. NPDC059408 TaxID=3346823 RepID=UPI0036803D7B